MTKRNKKLKNEKKKKVHCQRPDAFEAIESIGQHKIHSLRGVSRLPLCIGQHPYTYQMPLEYICDVILMHNIKTCTANEHGHTFT